MHNENEWVVTRRGCNDLSSDLKKVGVELYPGAMEMIKSISFPEQNQKCIVTLLTPEDLGYAADVSIFCLFKKAKCAGFALCPPDVVLHMWIQHPNFLSIDSYVDVAMESINGLIFSFECDHEGRFIVSSAICDCDQVSSTKKIMFVKSMQ